MPGPKKAQRTKGNVKPSSSSQAAQLLAASGYAPSGFIGFSSQPAFVPVSETFDDVEASINDEFRLVMRRLSKRDSVTKIKALQEFITLCNSKDEECVKAVVPFWPRVYNKISIDVDHKVRELSQKALGTLAARSKKALAPHLKSIMGLWMASMCDVYPVVATAANSAFISTFSAAKQADAVIFCKAEIAECLMSNILQHSPQTLSDPLTTSEEDMESKYQRVISSSLQALRKLMFMLPSDSVTDSMLPCLTKLLDSPNFWKHAKSTVPQIKCGVLSVLSATCQLCPQVSGKVISKVAPLVFSFLDSQDSGVVSHTWEAVLSLVRVHEDCWQHVNWQKAVWPKLKRVLESGCSGQATIVCPCLLPLLSKIPNRNFTQFFDSFRLGLREESVLHSSLDMSALVHSFIECVLYAVKSLAETGGNTTEIRGLLLDQVLIVVQASLTDSKPGLSKTDLYSRLNTLLSAVGKTDASIETEFWSELSTFIRSKQLVSEYVSAEKHAQEGHGGRTEPALFNRIKLLFEGVVFQQASTAGKKERVTFVTEESHLQIRKSNLDKEKQPLSEPVVVLISDIFVAVFKIVSLNEHTMPLFFSLFKDLSVIHIPAQAAERLLNKSDRVAVLVISELESKPETDFISSLEDSSKMCMRFQEGASGREVADSFREFVCGHLVKLLLYVQKEEVLLQPDGEQFSDDVVVAVFAYVAYVDQEEGGRILAEILDGLTGPGVTCQFIEHLVGNVNCIPACHHLVLGTKLARKIELLTIAAVAGEDRLGRSDGACRAVWKMLTSVVSSLDESDNHLFSQSCLDAVILNCLSTLKQLQQPSHSPALMMVDTVDCVVGLVLALFDKQKISMHPQLGELVLNVLPLLLNAEEDSLRKLKAAWLLGLQIILEKKSDVEIQQCVQQFCDVVKLWVQAGASTYEGLTRVGKAIEISVKTIASPSWEEDDSEQSEPDNKWPGVGDDEEVDEETLSTVLNGLLMIDSAEVDCWTEVCEYLFIDGKLQYLPPASQHAEASRASLQSYMTGALYNLDVLLLNMELRHRLSQKLEPSCPRIVVQWSESQLLTLAETAYRFVVLETALKLRPEDIKEFPSSILPDLQAGLVKCFKSLKMEQLLFIADLASHRADRAYIFTYSIRSVLEAASRSQLEEAGKTLPQFSSALLLVWSSFLYRCVKSEQLVSDVSQLLNEKEVSEGSICEAFAIVTAAIFSCEDVNLQDLSDSLSGFLSLAEHCDVLKDDMKLSLFQQITAIVKQLKERNIQLLSASNTAEPTVEQYHLNISVVRVLKSLAVPCHEYYWEFTLCALVEWIQFLAKVNLSQKSDAPTKALFTSVCELAYLAAHTFNTAPVMKEATAEASYFVTEKAKTEWNEFFSEGVFSQLLPVFVSLASATPTSSGPLWASVMFPLSSVVSLCPAGQISSQQIPARLTTTDKSGLPDNIKTLLNHLCPLLVSRLRCVEVAAYRLLSSIMAEIPKHDVVPEDEDKQEEELRSPPEALIKQVDLGSHFLEYLKLVQVDEHVEMERGTDDHAHAMGYLLAWRLLLQLFSCSPNQLRAKYAQYFKTNDLVSRLLDTLFRLMPQYPSGSMLEFTAELSVQAGDSDAELSTLALYVYRQCLEILPALVRTWWVDQDRKSSNFVDKFTMLYLSNSLIRQQVTSAQSTNNSIDGITIVARPAAREVSATYEMAEVTVNMTITLPENYPLGKLGIACDKRIGVSQAQWDHWLLQLNIFLQHQNGSILEGLRLWKGNIDKKFEGIEDCMICFSVIHGTTFQLPRLTCKTCRKKFHSACLYKWFNTAQKSSCPLCRNLF